jgi:Diphosphoinositol pentakisphosphate kinase 2 N-terminal domain/Histidine phosphatase superfamily (branch 2)
MGMKTSTQYQKPAAAIINPRNTVFTQTAAKNKQTTTKTTTTTNKHHIKSVFICTFCITSILQIHLSFYPCFWLLVFTLLSLHTPPPFPSLLLSPPLLLCPMSSDAKHDTEPVVSSPPTPSQRSMQQCEHCSKMTGLVKERRTAGLRPVPATHAEVTELFASIGAKADANIPTGHAATLDTLGVTQESDNKHSSSRDDMVSEEEQIEAEDDATFVRTSNGPPIHVHWPCLWPQRRVVLGVCAMDKKTRSKPMTQILDRLRAYGEFEIVVFGNALMLDDNVGVEDWPLVDCLIAFFSSGFPLQKALDYTRLRRPHLINDLEMQTIFRSRKKVCEILQQHNIPTPRRIVVERDANCDTVPYVLQSDGHIFVEWRPRSAEPPVQYVQQLASYVEMGPEDDTPAAQGTSSSSSRITSIDGTPIASPRMMSDDSKNRAVSSFLKADTPYKTDFMALPLVEKPFDGDDHNVYIYYGGRRGSRRLFRKKKNQSSAFHPSVNRLRLNGSYVYEEFMAGGKDLKVYTLGPGYAHGETRKSPAVDGIVERDPDDKELRLMTKLTDEEKSIARRVAIAFKQNVCGFDFIRWRGRSYVIDVNGWSFVKGNLRYYDKAARILRKMCLASYAGRTAMQIGSFPMTLLSEERIRREVFRNIAVDYCGEDSVAAGAISEPVRPSLTEVEEPVAPADSGAGAPGGLTSTIHSYHHVGQRPYRLHFYKDAPVLTASMVSKLESKLASESGGTVPDAQLQRPRSATTAGTAQGQPFVDGETGDILRGLVSVFRHADRMPKQKIKLKTKDRDILSIFDRGLNATPTSEIKLTKGKIAIMEPCVTAVVKKHRAALDQLCNGPDTVSVDDIEKARFLLSEWEQVLHIVKARVKGMKVQLKPKSIVAGQVVKCLLVCKWGGQMTHSGWGQVQQYAPVFWDEMLRPTPPPVRSPATGLPSGDPQSEYSMRASNAHQFCDPEYVRKRSAFINGLQVCAADEERVRATAKAFIAATMGTDGDNIPSEWVRSDDNVQQFLDAFPREASDAIDQSKQAVAEIVMTKNVMATRNGSVETLLPDIKIADLAPRLPIDPLDLRPGTASSVDGAVAQTDGGVDGDANTDVDATLNTDTKDNSQSLIAESQSMPTSLQSTTSNASPSEMLSYHHLCRLRLHEAYSGSTCDPVAMTQWGIRCLRWLGVPHDTLWKVYRLLRALQKQIHRKLGIMDASRRPTSSDGKMRQKFEEYSDNEEEELAPSTGIEKPAVRTYDPEHQLCERESLLLSKERWDRVINAMFDSKTGKFDPTKIPDVYDGIKYDAQHNADFFEQIRPLYRGIKRVADFVIPHEYGVIQKQKLFIGRTIVQPLLNRIIHNLECGLRDEPQSRAFLYFSSESHLHSLRNSIVLSGLPLNTTVATYLESVELNYLSHGVFRLYEDVSRPPDHPARFYVNVQFSPGASLDPFIWVQDDHLLPVSRPVPVTGRIPFDEFREMFFRK